MLSLSLLLVLKLLLVCVCVCMFIVVVVVFIIVSPTFGKRELVYMLLVHLFVYVTCVTSTVCR